jgi:hypothetical protein
VRVSALVLTRVNRPAASGASDTEVLSVTGTMTGYAAFLPASARVADSTPSAGNDRP